MEYKSLTHSKWYCRYHIVWIPKYRRKKLFNDLRRELIPVLKELAKRRDSEIIEGKMLADHVHILLSVPPKRSVSDVVGFMKGKSAIEVARILGRKRNYSGQHFWARGYFVSTVGIEEATVQEYIRNQEEEDRRVDQLELFG